MQKKSKKIISRKDALENNLPRYFTGLPCKRNHIGERNSSDGKCIPCKRFLFKKRYQENSKLREKTLSRNYKYAKSEKGHETRRVWEREWYNQISKDPKWRLFHSLESVFKRWFKKGSIGTRSSQVEKLIGCSRKVFLNHLQERFNDSMTWDNYGTFWHIDHIVPKSLFDQNISDELKICWSYWNLRPLEAKKNIIKFNRVHPRIRILLEKKKYNSLKEEIKILNKI